ncbi:hypothetical protein HYC85_006124 [Camellia sinensis]|uniref:Uncharacterized protein n=1 Tax=Camellia sinensis TaxID=4442 RepID=A0A7J7I1V8_CAMSI|nr:hypothetical protein HYC85_006124 [Camellia sinensis]
MEMWQGSPPFHVQFTINILYIQQLESARKERKEKKRKEKKMREKMKEKVESTCKQERKGLNSLFESHPQASNEV